MPDRTLSNIPQKLNLQDYHEAEKKFLKIYSEYSFVKSVYSFGTVTSPGISDLDFVVSVKDEASLPKKLSYTHFDKRTSYILSHNPFIFQESVFFDINKISNFGLLKHKTGTKHKKLDYVEYDQDFSLLILVDYCNYFYPRIFLSFASEDTLDVRLSIQLLNAFTHSISLFRKITASKSGDISQEFDNFALHLKEFKENFFFLSKKGISDNLLLLLNEAAIKSSELVKSLDKFINQYYWTNTLSTNKIIFKRSGYVFIQNYPDSLEIIKQMKKLKEIFGGWISVLPVSFAYPIIKYGQEKGYVSELIKNNLIFERNDTAYIYFVKGLLDKMKIRIDLMNNHYKFCMNPKNKVAPVHDYYQMSGLSLNNNQLKSLHKYV